MELKLGVKCDLWDSGKLGDVKDEESNFPIDCYYRTNKLQSGTFVLAAPLAPLSHTSCDSPNRNPWAIREVPVHVSPRSRTTFTRKPALPVNRPDFLWTDSRLGSQPGLNSLSLSFCRLLTVSPFLLRKIVVRELCPDKSREPPTDGMKAVKQRRLKKEDRGSLLIKRQCSDVLFRCVFFFRFISLPLR